MLSASILGIVTIPLVYAMFQKMREKFHTLRGKELYAKTAPPDGPPTDAPPPSSGLAGAALIFWKNRLSPIFQKLAGRLTRARQKTTPPDAPGN
jgi:hypothetical protein